MLKIFLGTCLLEADRHRPMVKTPKSTDHAHILKANNMIQYNPLSGSAKLYCLWSIKVIQYLTEGWTWYFGCDSGGLFGQSSLLHLQVHSRRYWFSSLLVIYIYLVIPCLSFGYWYAFSDLQFCRHSHKHCLFSYTLICFVFGDPKIERLVQSKLLWKKRAQPTSIMVHISLVSYISPQLKDINGP